MILIVIGRRASLARPLWMALAATLCVLGLENQVQASPADRSIAGARIALWLHDKRKRRSLAQRPSGLALAIGSVVAAVIAVSVAWPLITVGLDRTLLDTAGFRPLLFGRFGVYQAALGLLAGWLR